MQTLASLPSAGDYLSQVNAAVTAVADLAVSLMLVVVVLVAVYKLLDAFVRRAALITALLFVAFVAIGVANS
jgi:hypothetical protein